MDLPVSPTVKPMLAKAVGDEVPSPDSVPGGLLFEPKWDGFRILLFKDGDEIVLQSRDEKDLGYCFPEMLDAARRHLPPRIVLDGELVVAHDGRLWFSELGNRIRPRSEAGGWKIAELSQQSPVSYVAFDLLSDGDRSLMDAPFDERRARLEQALSDVEPPFHLTPITDDLDVAREWFHAFEGAGLDGLVCKPRSGSYTPDVRSMLKVKHDRSVDVVVAGWRPHKNAAPDGREMVGALLLGLYDDEGRLHNVGSSSAFTASVRADMADLLRELEPATGEAHPWLAADAETARQSGQRIPGGVSRWTGTKDLSFHPVRPALVAEVRYDHLEGEGTDVLPRFRHSARFVRWRPDRDASSCTYGQLDLAPAYDLARVLMGASGPMGRD